MHADRHTSRWVYTIFWTLTTIALNGAKVTAYLYKIYNSNRKKREFLIVYC